MIFQIRDIISLGVLRWEDEEAFTLQLDEHSEEVIDETNISQTDNIAQISNDNYGVHNHSEISIGDNVNNDNVSV